MTKEQIERQIAFIDKLAERENKKAKSKESSTVQGLCAVSNTLRELRDRPLENSHFIPTAEIKQRLKRPDKLPQFGREVASALYALVPFGGLDEVISLLPLNPTITDIQKACDDVRANQAARALV